jgi:S-adenosylmethionine:tRNA ribosyltransferase-isomerase
MDDFDYELPPELIAQEPLAERADSRLMVLDKTTGAVEHRAFVELSELLRAGDLLVVNDSRVIPARLLGHRASGAQVEVLVLRPEAGGGWRALAHPTKRLNIGERLFIPARDGYDHASASLVLREKLGDGQVIVDLDDELSAHLEGYGRVPLPPYITHRLEDDERYQTVYAAHKGSAAAPTAGLHFTPAIFDRLRDRGVNVAEVTLHVGLDTFRPVKEEFADEHQIHSEWCSVSESTLTQIQAAREWGGRVVAVGTTAARTLETLGKRIASGQHGAFDAFTDIYITPGYSWQVVDAMVTNFHLPKSTLMLMISALAGREHVLAAYRQAIKERYRFFSFGDAMLIR